MRKGQFVTFRIKYRSDSISGILLDNRNGWLLIERCVDYRTDGYTLIRADLVVDQIFGDRERLASKILRKKYGTKKRSAPIKLESLGDIFQDLQNKYTLIQLDTKKGDAFDVVKYLSSRQKVYIFRELTANAKWRFKLELSTKEITVVSFGNDYLDSLLLVI